MPKPVAKDEPLANADTADTAAVTVPEDPAPDGDAAAPDDAPAPPPPRATMGELFQYADGVDKALIAVGTVSAVITGAGAPAFSEIFGRLIAELSSPDLAQVEDQVSKVALAMFILGCVFFFTGLLQTACWLIAAERQTAVMRVKYFAALLRQEAAFHDEHKPGGLAAHVAGDIKVVTDGMSDRVAAGILSLSMALTGFGLGFYRSWELTLLMLGALPLISIPGGVMAAAMPKLMARSREGFSKAGEVADEALSNVKTVQVFEGEEREVERFGKELDQAASANVVKEFVLTGGTGTIFFVMFMIYAAAFRFSAFLIEEDRRSAADIVTCFFAVLMGSFGVGRVFHGFSGLTEAAGAAYKLFEVIKRTSAIPLDSDEPRSRLDTVRGEISFKNVAFSYPTRKETTLFTDLNLTIKAGTTVALAGASGCGKSSIIALVQRLYDPDAGTVTIDGVDLKDLDLRWWRDQIGVVSQEPALFSGTVAENIRIGKPDATQQEVEAACREADVHDTVMSLPDQYETDIGSVGSQLSGGQKQRLAIARAIIKRPRLLILDEATSALDRRSEMEVQAALDRLMADGHSKRTVLVIAHRLVTIRNADQICFVARTADAGSAITEAGTFDKLVAKKNGAFAHMVRAQAKSGEASADTRQGSVAAIDTGLATKAVADDDDAALKKPETIEERAQREEAEATVPTLRLAKLTLPKLWALLMGLLGSVITGGTMPAYGLVFSRLVDVLSRGDAAEIRDKSPLWTGLFAVIATSSLIGWILQGFYIFAGEHLTRVLRTLLLRNLLRQDATFFDMPKHDTGALGGVLAGDCETVHLLWGPALGIQIQMGCNLVAGLVIGLIHSWRVALVTLAGLPLVVITTAAKQVVVYGLNKSHESPEASVVTETLVNYRTVAAFNFDRNRVAKYDDAVHAGRRLGTKTAIISGLAYGSSQLCIYGVFALSFWYGGKLIAEGKENFSDVMVAAMSVLMGAVGAGQAGGSSRAGPQSQAAAKRVFSFIDRVPDIDPLSGGAAPAPGPLALKGVEFRYPARPAAVVLRDFNNTLPAGHSLGLVGSTGCGKSTIVQLLARYYDPVAGNVTVGGQDLRGVDLAAWRRELSIVSQEPALFSGTVAENIRYSRPEATDAEVERAARLAAVHDEVLAMEKGYGTEVGYKGKQLSGGQKQRVAIARGLLRKPRLLLLDEATSALDAATEAKVQRGVQEACKEHPMAIVSVAHRLTTIQHSDKIVVLDSGVVLEQGTHKELMARPDGDYRGRYEQFTMA